MTIQRRKHPEANRVYTIERLEDRRLLSAFAETQDIGNPPLTGSTSSANGTYTLTGNGTDIGGNSDQFHFASNPWNASGSITVKVGTIANTHQFAKAGVMFRNGLAGNAAFSGLFLTPANYLYFINRNTDGTIASQNSYIGFANTRFLRLSRAGGEISAFHSPDGSTWTQAGTTQTIVLGSSTRVGLAVTSRNVAALTTATFTSLSLLLPAGWASGDIGAPAIGGTTIFDTSTSRFTLQGGGSGIGTTADQFTFASRGTMGDGSLIARVESQTSTDPLARAGVMIRSDLTGSSAFASVTLSPQGQLAFQWRANSGAVSVSSNVTGITGVRWLKLTQKSNSFTAFYSSDAISWTQVGSAQPVTMTSAAAFAGVMTTASNAVNSNEAVFSGVSVTQGEYTSRDIGSPGAIGSASFDPASSTYTIQASGSDIYGTSDQFHFVSRSYIGDGSIVGYVNSITNTNPWAKAGLMFRVSNAADAAFAGVFASPQNGIVFEWRTSQGAPVSQQVSSPPGGPVAAPVSLKLTRVNSTFSGYYSTDGLSWVLIGPAQAVSMPSKVLAGAAVTSHNDGVLCSATITGLTIAKNPPPGAGIFSAADEAFLNDLESRTIKYFYSETNPATGLIPDGALANGGSNGSASSIAAIGFGLSALTIADQRGFLTHTEAYQRALTTVNFLYNNAAHVNGFYYHFLNTTTGARSGTSELSTIDTALLMAGVLNVAAYWSGTAAATTAMNIYNRVNWPWMQKPNLQYYGAWSPEQGFQYGYGDFSEAALLYLLGLGSPTFPTSRASWNSWSRSPARSYGGYNYITAQGAALFTVQYPLGWYDLRGLQDSYGLNYHENAKTATLAQRQWMMDIAGTYPSFGPNMWGLTASDSVNGYAVWGGPPASGPIDGTVVPTGPGGSLAFTPRHSVDALRHMQQTYGANVYRKYGFVDAFNPTSGWTSSIVLGIDAGMMLLAAENARSGFVWDVFGKSSPVRQSVAAAFTTVTPTLYNATSRKLFPNASPSDVALDVSDPSIEARHNGPTQLILNFGTNILKGPNFAITLTDANGNPNGTVSSSTVSGTNLTINLSGVNDATILKVSITDLRNYSTTAAGNYVFQAGVLLADATHDGKVDTRDFNALAGNFGLPATSDTQGDFNVDALVDSVDFNLLLSNHGRSLSLPSGASVLSAAPVLFARNDDDDEVDELDIEPP